MGAISEDKLTEAVRKQVQGRALLGEILVDMGYITSAQLDNALRAQRLMREGRKVEAMLVLQEESNLRIDELRENEHRNYNHAQEAMSKLRHIIKA